jgi:hypothetical protein
MVSAACQGGSPQDRCDPQGRVAAAWLVAFFSGKRRVPAGVQPFMRDRHALCFGWSSADRLLASASVPANDSVIRVRPSAFGDWLGNWLIAFAPGTVPIHH